MHTFGELLAETAKAGTGINTMFEERLFGIIGNLERISFVFAAACIPYEVIGGVAVLIHVEEANPEYTALTRDIDLMVNRCDLPLIKDRAAEFGFRFRHAAGLDMLILGETGSAKDAIHLIFSEERVRPTDLIAAPPINPDRKRIHGKEFMVVPVADLVAMKLNSYRDKDRVHVRSLDACGLITPEVEANLTTELLARLKHVRETE